VKPSKELTEQVDVQEWDNKRVFNLKSASPFVSIRLPLYYTITIALYRLPLIYF